MFSWNAGNPGFRSGVIWGIILTHHHLEFLESLPRTKCVHHTFMLWTQITIWSFLFQEIKKKKEKRKKVPCSRPNHYLDQIYLLFCAYGHLHHRSQQSFRSIHNCAKTKLASRQKRFKYKYINSRHRKITKILLQLALLSTTKYKHWHSCSKIFNPLYKIDSPLRTYTNASKQD